MGEPHAARMDIAAMLTVARQYDAVADLVDNAVRVHLGKLMFDGATAGRLHAARGDALRIAVEHIVDGLTQWSRAAAEIAAELRAGADRYLAAERRGAERIG